MEKDLVVSVSGFISAVLAVYCGIPYLRSIVKGKTKPHKLGWLVFALTSGVSALSQYLKGGRASILIALTFFIYSSIIFFLALSRGSKKTSRSDWFLFGLSIATIIAWILTDNPALAIWLTILVDIFATIMILLKVRADPHSEAPFPWVIASVAYIFSCIALANKPFGILYARPIYGLLSEAAVPAYVYYLLGRRKGIKKDRLRP